MGDVAYGWIGSAPGNAPADRAEHAPSLVVSAAHSALGAVTRLQVRVGEVTVLLSPAGGTGAEPADWVRDSVADELDIAALLAARMDLVGRGGEPVPERWDGRLPVSRYAAFRTADPGDAEALARSAGCPAALVRALARPVSLSRVEVVRRDGAARGSARARSASGERRGPVGPSVRGPACPRSGPGPTMVSSDELAWVDGGDDGLWTVRPGGPEDVSIGSGTPDEVAEALAGLVRAAEGC